MRLNARMSTRSIGSADSHVIRYRTDVDGLRAVAVLSVVCYHVSKSLLPGGYLGVDMFFVLSGYLITSIVWTEVNGGLFSIVRFYDRRLRRIMPALLVVILFSTLAALALLLPADLIGYGRSLLSTNAFVANVYFWRDTNYFSPNAGEKPLLHLWSLSVEEQFYILFPLTLLLLARWWSRGALLIIALLTVGSLFANVLALYVGGESPAFFLLPTRAWELGLGAVLAMLPLRATPGAAMANVAASIGALLVVVGMVHPLHGFAIVPVAIPAVAGTGLLVLAGEQNLPLVNRALSLRPLVFCGLISYSLYLWHWPVLVFSRYYLVRELTLGELFGALVLMTGCAIVSWRVVERPFRSKSMSIRKVRLAVGAGVAALVVSAMALILSDGLPRRLNSSAAAINEAVGNNYRCPFSEYLKFGMSRACQMNLPSRNTSDADVILLGNSHAQMYEPVWASILAARGQTGLLVPLNACLPTVQANLDRECAAAALHNLAAISQLTRATTVIIGLNWWHGRDGLVDSTGHLVDNTNSAGLVSAVDDLIDRLHRAGKQVVLIGPIAEPGWDVASVISRQLAFGHPADRPPYMEAAEFLRHFESVIRHFEARTDIGFARPDRIQCSADRCNYLMDGRSLFSDSTHIAAGELQRFRALFEAALPPPDSPHN
jgi:peptidoglycan/LPS O-acetylase OafA/YrhL